MLNNKKNSVQSPKSLIGSPSPRAKRKINNEKYFVSTKLDDNFSNFNIDGDDDSSTSSTDIIKTKK